MVWLNKEHIQKMVMPQIAENQNKVLFITWTHEMLERLKDLLCL